MKCSIDNAKKSVLLKTRHPSFAHKMMSSELTVLTQEQDLGITTVLWKCHFRTVNVHFVPQEKKNLKNHMKETDDKKQITEKKILLLN